MDWFYCSKNCTWRAIEMRLILSVLAGLFLCPAFADTTLDFDKIRVEQLAKVVFGEVLHADYILDSSIKDETVSVHWNVPDDKSRQSAILLPLMRRVGLNVDLINGVYQIGVSEKKSEPDEPFIYKPKWRSVTYLVDLVAGLFKPGSFTTRRALQQGVNGQISQQYQQPVGNQIQGLQVSSSYAQPVPVDNGTNAYSQFDKQPDVLVFKGSAKDADLLSKLLVQIDTPTPEVLVKAVVYEVTSGEDNKSALSLAASILGGKLGFNLGPATQGDYSGYFKSANFQAIFDALSSDNRFKVVSSPSLRVKHGGKARLVVGNQTPVISSTILTGTGTSQQSVEYKPSGIILDLAPEIRDEVTELKLMQQISQFVTTTTGVNNTPTLVTRELTTSVGIRGDEVLVIGGLDETKDNATSSGLSFLPEFLRAKMVSKSKAEILLVLQAQRI